MDTLLELPKQWDKLLDEDAPASELAELLEKWAVGPDRELEVVATLAGNNHMLFEKNYFKQWPIANLDCLCLFLRAMPSQPLGEGNEPCGTKELLLAKAFSDETIPSVIRGRLWRMVAQDGYLFPCYQLGKSWSVPPLFSGHFNVREWMVKTKQPGWEDLRFSDLRFLSSEFDAELFKTKEEKGALASIHKDSPSELLVPLSITGKKLPKLYFDAILRLHAVKTLIALYHLDDPSFSKVFQTPRQMLFFICANSIAEEMLPWLEELENANPGLVKDTIDEFGFDALWFTFFQPDAPHQLDTILRKKLVELGCDPNRRIPRLGLFFAEVLASYR